MRITFCCTGNTCRSPMAEFIMRDMLDKRRVRDVEVDSVGVYCADGLAMSGNARIALKNLGIDAGEHFSRMITAKDIDDSDYIFTMTKAHAELLRANFGVCDNVYALGDYVGEGDVNDPYGGNELEYTCSAVLIRNLLDKLCDKLFPNNPEE